MLSLARAALRRPRLVLALFAAATAVMAAGLGRLQLRTDGAAIYPRGNPTVVRTLQDQETFQELPQVIVLLTARPGGPAVASPAGFRFLKRVHAGLLALPGVEDLGVRSLADLVEPPPSANLLDIHDFLATVPEGPAFADLLARIRRMPLAGALLLSPDGRAAALYVAVAKGADRGTLIAAIERFLGSPDLAAASGFELRVTGPVAAETVLGREVLRDLSRLVPLMVAAVALLLWLSLRTPGGIFIPLAQVLATLVWTLGGMGWAGMPVTLFTTVLPVLLMAMAMTDEIHLLVRVQDRLREGEEFPEPGHLRSGSQTEPPIVIPSESEGPGGRAARDLLLQEVRETAPRPGPSLTLGMTEAGFSRGNRVSRSAAAAAEAADANRRARLVGALSAAYADLTAPLALSSIATATGFLSFLFTSIGPLAQFGLATGVGMLFAMLFTFSLVPALAVVLPAGWIERRALAGDPSDRGLASAAERLLTRRGGAAALAAAALVLAALPGLFRLRVEDSWADNFDPRSPLVTAERDFNAAFWGSWRCDVVFSGKGELFATPAGVALLERFGEMARRAPHAGGVLSIQLPYETAARIYGDPLPVSRLPPREVMRISLLIEALQKRIDLRNYATLDRTAARARVFVKDADYSRGRALVSYLERRLPEVLTGLPAMGVEGVRAHLSGDLTVAMEVVGSVVGNQLRSIAWTALAIAAMLACVYRSLRLTAIVMTPVAAATLLIFAGLGWAGIPLGIATSMFAALTLGAGVDFALHYLHAYRRERAAGRPHQEAVAATLATAGRGLWWNAVVLACGFAVLTLSAISPNARLGLLLAAAMLASYSSTVVILPELLRRFE